MVDASFVLWSHHHTSICRPRNAYITACASIIHDDQPDMRDVIDYLSMDAWMFALALCIIYHISWDARIERTKQG